MQYLYWEKVQSSPDGPVLRSSHVALMPLMRNWSQLAASLRDEFDAQHGRGSGNPLISVWSA